MKIGPTNSELINKAWRLHKVIPGFNIPYLPMMAPVVNALRDTNSFGLIMVARLEWEKFQSKSIEAIRDEYEKVKDEKHTRLHLDHVPVIDEDNKRVDYEEIVSRAIHLGYGSVMVDGSRLSLEENIACTKRISDLAHAAGIPAEGELGAVMGHESGPVTQSYDEIFASGKGFTDASEAVRFVRESGVDWLSVAIGNIHGAISAARRTEKKTQARLNIQHLASIDKVTRVPLVLHGGSGISKQCIMDAIGHGIAKINIGTTIRQAYEVGAKTSVEAGRKAVYEAVVKVVKEELEIEGSADVYNGAR